MQGQGLGDAAAHAARWCRLVAHLKELVEPRDGHVLNHNHVVVGQEAVVHDVATRGGQNESGCVHERNKRPLPRSAVIAPPARHLKRSAVIAPPAPHVKRSVVVAPPAPYLVRSVVVAPRVPDLKRSVVIDPRVPHLERSFVSGRKVQERHSAPTSNGRGAWGTAEA